jgi:outer membrane receptor for ferrienterochelin and colicins
VCLGNRVSFSFFPSIFVYFCVNSFQDKTTVNPRLFLYPSEKTQINLGINTVFEDRLGGDIQYINGESSSSHRYFERNKTQRLSSQLAVNHRLGSTGQLTFKNSVSYFNRTLSIPQYTFDGNQVSTFSEANYSLSGEKAEWVMGVNAVTDQFREKQLELTPLRDYTQTTLGGFIQNSLTANTWLNIETGLRGDYVVDYGFALLPRISALFKINPNLTSRLGGGLGYKAPSIFTEETERLQFKGILPVTSGTNKLERSYGANWDFTYRTSFANDAISFNINHLFFYTYLNNPLMLFPAANERYELRNIGGHIDTKGTETNIKIGYENLNLFLGYTFTDTKIHENQLKTTNPLTPKHRVNTVLMYEIEEKWKLGLEAYYFGEQRLSDGSTDKPYVINGFMAEKLWERFSLYVNSENFLDVRQTRFDTIYTGNITNPVFRDIYAPLDGFVVNGGIKIRL